MTGQLLAGDDATVAAKYQIMIMFAISGVSACGCLAATLSAASVLVDGQHRLRLDRLKPRVTMAAHARSCVECAPCSSMFMHSCHTRVLIVHRPAEECLVTHKQSLLPNWQATVRLTDVQWQNSLQCVQGHKLGSVLAPPRA
jgi:hypothetical protein